MMPDYIPSEDAKFNDWQQQFTAYATTPANLTRWGLTPSAVAQLISDQTAWNTDYPAHLDMQRESQVVSQRKEQTGLTYKTSIRSVAGQLQRNPAVTNEDRAALHITIPKDTRTPSPIPTTTPQGRIEVARLQHTIHFVDSATPTVKARPDGVLGCQIYTKIGGPLPTSPDELHFIALDTKTPYVLHFEMEEGNQIAYYLLRWQNARGETGPWSAILSATIPA